MLRKCLGAAMILAFFLPLQTLDGANYSNVFEGAGMEGLSHAWESGDGGAIAAGFTSTGTGGDDDALLMRFDANGNALWTLAYGGNGDEIASGVRLGTDGNYWAVGSTSSSGAGGTDVLVTRFTAAGSVLWHRTYGTSFNDAAFDLGVLSDGSIIIAGTSNTSQDIPRLLALRVTSQGALSWSKILGDIAGGTVMSLTSDGGVAIGGFTASYTGEVDFLVVKLDINGNVLWSYQFGGSGTEYVQGIAESSDLGLLVSGMSEAYGAGGQDWLVFKLNSSGAVQWQKTYGGTGDESFPRLRLLSDGSALLGGPCTSYSPAATLDLLMIKINSSGQISWSHRFSHPVKGLTGGIFPLDAAGIGAFGMLSSTMETDGEVFSLGLDASGSMLGCAYLFDVAVPSANSSMSRSSISLSVSSYTLNTGTATFASAAPAFSVWDPCLPPTATPTRTATRTMVPTVTRTPTLTPTTAPTRTPTSTPTAGPGSPTHTPPPTWTASPTMTATPTEDPETPTGTPTGPTYTPTTTMTRTPTRTPSPPPTLPPTPPPPTMTPPATVPPTASPLPPSPTPAPDCPTTGVMLVMPRTFYHTGNTFYLDADVCNAAARPLGRHLLFVILEVAGEYWFAPSWTQGTDYLEGPYAPGKSTIEVIAPFSWPGDVGVAMGIKFWGAFTDIAMSSIFGEYSMVEFGFGP